MNYYTTYTSEESIKMTEDEHKQLLSLLEEERLDEDGFEMFHGMTLKFHDGEGYFVSDDDDSSEIDNVADAFFESFGVLIGRQGLDYLTVGYAHTAGRNAPSSHSGGVLRIYSSGLVLYPKLVWNVASSSVEDLSAEVAP